MTPKTKTALRRVAGGALLAAAILLARPSSGRAYSLNGVWAPPDVPWLLPAAATARLRALCQAAGLGVAPHWDGYRWVGGHWRTY